MSCLKSSPFLNMVWNKGCPGMLFMALTSSGAFAELKILSFSYAKSLRMNLESQTVVNRSGSSLRASRRSFFAFDSTSLCENSFRFFVTLSDTV